MPEAGDERPATAEATVTNAGYWAAHALELASALSAGLTVVGDPSGQPTKPEQVAVVVNPAWWAGEPQALAEALTADSPAPVAPADGRSPSATDTSTNRLTLTVEEAAAVLGISRASAYEAVHHGQIPCIRIGRRILVPRVALDRMLAAAAGLGEGGGT